MVRTISSTRPVPQGKAVATVLLRPAMNPSRLFMAICCMLFSLRFEMSGGVAGMSVLKLTITRQVRKSGAHKHKHKPTYADAVRC